MLATTNTHYPSNNLLASSTCNLFLNSPIPVLPRIQIKFWKDPRSRIFFGFKHARTSTQMSKTCTTTALSSLVYQFSIHVYFEQLLLLFVLRKSRNLPSTKAAVFSLKFLISIKPKIKKFITNRTTFGRTRALSKRVRDFIADAVDYNRY